MVGLAVGLTGTLLPVVAGVGTAGLNCVRGNSCVVVSAFLKALPVAVFFLVWGSVSKTLTLYLGFSAVASLFVAGYVDADANADADTSADSTESNQK